MMMTKKELLALHDTLSKKAKEIMVKKNQDYTGGSEDPFANFRGAEMLGVDPILGLMIRMTDKMQRVKSFILTGELAVTDESVADIGPDLMNYCVLMQGMLNERLDGIIEKLTAPDAVEEPPKGQVPADDGFDLEDPNKNKGKGGNKK